MKQQIRSRILNDIKSIQASQRSEKSAAVQLNLKKLLSHEKGLWAGFHSLLTEPQIHWNQVSENIQWCFPKMVDGNVLQFKKSVSKNQLSGLGVLEPIDGADVPVSEISGVVLPAVAFDKAGNRLGRGKGFYDRTLKNFSGKKIGICFEVALIDVVPTEEHDIRCDQIVTENNIYNMAYT